MERTHKNASDQGWLGFFIEALLAPLLLSLQPILKLYSINVAELGLGDVLRPLLASLLFAVLVVSLARLFFTSWRRANLFASLFLIIFFLFGDLSDWLQASIGWGPVRTDFIFLAIVAAVLTGWRWWVRRGLKNERLVQTYFNLLSVLFFLNSSIGLFVKLSQEGAFTSSSQEPVIVNRTTGDQERPDIYYIILDAYGREDILQELYQFDNSPLVKGLQSRGFYVAGQSSSNYIQTMLSLTSSLNMDYLQTMIDQGRVTENRYELIDVLQHSEVRRILSGHGYEMVSFHNEYKATVPDAEVYYDDARTGFLSPVSAFEGIVLDHTLARVVLVWRPINDVLIGMPYRMHSQNILSTFQHLREIPGLDGNYFVYAHVIAPHPPFVFDAEGNFLEHFEPFTLNDANYYIKDHSRKGYIAGYRKQIQYINTLLLQTVDEILANSKTPPIIIIQGDHGPGAYLHWGSLDSTLPAERFGILNAYYFPARDYEMLYPAISPVNSFRVVMNQYFDGDYRLLPDQHYYSAWSFPFEFTEVTDLSLP